jgi:hypothetical protein
LLTVPIEAVGQDKSAWMPILVDDHPGVGHIPPTCHPSRLKDLRSHPPTGITIDTGAINIKIALDVLRSPFLVLPQSFPLALFWLQIFWLQFSVSNW